MTSGGFTVGDLALFSSYLTQVTAFTGFLGFLINTFNQSGVSFKRMLQLLGNDSSAAERLVERHEFPRNLQQTFPVVKRVSREFTSLDIRGVTYLYPGSDAGIKNIHFHVDRGTITVVTGPIGAGKSTLIRAVLGLLVAQHGQIWWNGDEVEHPADFLVPPRTVYTPQYPNLLSGTLRENIAMGAHDHDDRISQAVTTAALRMDLSHLPNGLDTVLGTRGYTLSGGQVQRVAIARMLFREAALYVCDDVTSSRDSETSSRFWRGVLQLDATFLLVSNDRYVLGQADQVLVLKDGSLS